MTQGKKVPGGVIKALKEALKRGSFSFDALVDKERVEDLILEALREAGEK